VDQGSASVVDGAGVAGSCGLWVEAESPFTQARLTLGRSLLAAPELYFDSWVRLPPAPWLVLDETFDIDGARIGLFSSPSLLGATEWHVFNGDGAGGGYWLGTGVAAPVDQGLGITSQFTRMTVRLDGLSPTWSLWIDGTRLASGLGLQFPPEPDRASFFALGDSQYPVLLDNITISADLPAGITSGSETTGPPPPDTPPLDLTDSDADGMPDAWETAQGLDPADPADAMADRDGDGFSSLTEYLLGTRESVKETRRQIVPEGALVFNRFDGVTSRRVVKSP